MLLATALIPRLFSAMPLIFKVTSMGSFVWQMLHIVLVPWEAFLQSGRPRLKVPSPTLDGLPSTPSSHDTAKQGPSLWAFDSSDILDSSSSPGDSIPATAYMNFLCSYSGDTHISEGALLWAEQGTIGPFCPANPFGIILQKVFMVSLCQGSTF